MTLAEHVADLTHEQREVLRAALRSSRTDEKQVTSSPPLASSARLRRLLEALEHRQFIGDRIAFLTLEERAALQEVLR